MGRKPYLVRVGAQQVRGWRTVDNRNQAPSPWFATQSGSLFPPVALVKT